MILESSVPFTIDRELTPNEFDDVLQYCMYDVDSTIDVFHERLRILFQAQNITCGNVGERRCNEMEHNNNQR